MNRPALALALLGVALLTNPLWLAPDADQPRYEYRAYDATVDTEADTVTWTDRDGAERSVRDLAGVDCYPLPEERACVLARGVLESGPVTVNRTYLPLDGARYVYLDDEVYRWRETEEDGRTTLALEAVGMEAAYPGAATGMAGLTDPEARAVRTGSATSLRDADPHQLVYDGEDYHYLRVTPEPAPVSDRDDLVFRGAGALAGVFCLVRAHNRARG